MASIVMMKHKTTGIVKQGFYGYSWTYLFFGFWVPLLRGHYGMAGIHFLIAILSYVTLGIPQIILSFMFNKFYTLRLLEDGYIFADTPENNQTAARVLNVSL